MYELGRGCWVQGGAGGERRHLPARDKYIKQFTKVHFIFAKLL